LKLKIVEEQAMRTIFKLAKLRLFVLDKRV